MRKVKLTRTQVLRTGRLMHMRYTPAELADEVGFRQELVYRAFVPAGCPHERDEKGHILIVGTDFAEWAKAQSWGERATGPKLADGEAYCFHCRRAVKMDVIVVTPTNPYSELVKGTCAECGSNVNRARKTNRGEAA